MVSLKKSLATILMILCLNVNNFCSAGYGGFVSESKLILQFESEGRLQAKVDKYKQNCEYAVKYLCTKGEGKGCNADIKIFVETIVREIAYDDIEYIRSPYFGSRDNLDEPGLGHAKSFINYVWDNIETTNKIETPETYCTNYSNNYGLDKKQCKVLMDDNGFYELNNYSSKGIDPFKNMYFKWRLSNNTAKFRNENQKNLIMSYLQHNLDNYTIKDSLLLSKENNIAELYCQKKMCEYEIENAYHDQKQEETGFMSKLLKKKESVAYSLEEYIIDAFKYIAMDKVHYPIAKVFIALIYPAINISHSKLTMPDIFCDNLNSIKYSKQTCKEELNSKNLKNSINEVVETIYFDIAYSGIGNKNFPNEGRYVKLYIDSAIKGLQISSDNLKYGDNAAEFCKLFKLT